MSASKAVFRIGHNGSGSRAFKAGSAPLVYWETAKKAAAPDGSAKMPLMPRAILAMVALMGAFAASSSPAAWRRDDTSLAWTTRDGHVLWSFSFDPRHGKPHFATLAPGGVNLVQVQPGDHLWHYGLWFSWKFINGVNYWEETGPGGRAVGATRWLPPAIETDVAGNATIRLELTYVNPSGHVELTEQRVLRLSAPDSAGGFVIDWAARFVVGREAVVLDRTPMPGEPGGQVNGGYGGLGLRLAAAPLTTTVLTPAGAIDHFESDRARPRAAAVACNFAHASQVRGGVAIVNVAPAPAEIPWYVVNGEPMRFVCAAILAPQPLALAPGASHELHYRIAVQAGAWTPASLQALVDAP